MQKSDTVAEAKSKHEESLGPDPTMDSTATATSADHDGSPESRSTIARCRKCNTDFAECYNGWQRITGTYYLPSLGGSYSSPRLHTKSKPKLAAAESALHGCTIQPLACNNCEEVLAFTCIKAPVDKSAYAEREFFKLPKIQLRSEPSGEPVRAIIEDDHQPVCLKPQPTIEATTMEAATETTVATKQKPSLPSMTVLTQQSPADLRGHQLPSARTLPSQPLQPGLVMSERGASLQPRSRISSHSVAPSPTGHGAQHPVPPSNGTVATYERPSEQAMGVSAIDRIQTQVSSDRAMLETCARDMSRLETSFKKMQEEFRNTINDVRTELRASRQQPPAIPNSELIEADALEVFSSTLSGLVTKTAEIDVLKVTFEVIKQRLRHLEGGAVAPASTTHGHIPHHGSASLQRSAIAQHRQHVSSQHQLPEPRLLPSQPAQHTSYTPEPTSQRQPTQQERNTATGWNTVNAGLKRALPGNTDSIDTPLGSPKRAKLAPMEARYNYPEEPRTATASSYYQRRGTDEPTERQAYQQALQGSYASAFVPHTQDGSSDESWRPVSQRAVSGPALMGTSPRGRGRGRGRGGRPRKSMPLEPHLIATPEWEQDGWTGSQIEADGYYRGVPAKRGSGGVPGSAMVSPIHAVDPFGHTKRPRTKPSRNAEGVLIRKDGRPDLRSQSSAANLRKVHAKKEEDRPAAGEWPLLAGEEFGSVAESPASNDSRDVEPPDTQERTDTVMKRMFPRGIEEARARLKTAQQYFSSEQSQAGTAVSSPTQNPVSESEPNEGADVDRARDDSPQQQHGIEKDPQTDTIPVVEHEAHSLVTEQTSTQAKSVEPPNAIEVGASEPTASPTTLQTS